jgi:hypothetical protein
MGHVIKKTHQVRLLEIGEGRAYAGTMSVMAIGHC